MDIERTLETQQYRLLRIVAGLLLMLGILAVGPVSRRFSVWTLGFVGSVLSRVETAARYLVITRACLMVDLCGLSVDRRQISSAFAPEFGPDGASVSLAECRQRLWAVRDMLKNLPRHALRLLRRIVRQSQGEIASRVSTFDTDVATASGGWNLAANRIDRPPDKGLARLDFLLPLPPAYRAGGAGGCAG